MPTDETPAADAVVDAPASTDTTSTEAPAPWDGDFAKADTQPWWKDVPETDRAHFTRVRDEHQKATERAAYLDRLFNSDDATAELRKEVEARNTELATLKQSLEALGTESTGYRDRATALEARIADQEADADFRATEAKYPDIFKDVYYTDAEKTKLADKGAYMRFVKLCEAGWDREEAATAARTLLPKTTGTEPAVTAPAPLPKTRDVVVPPSIAGATPGGNSPSAVVSAQEANEDYKARSMRLRKEAEQEENRPR